MNSLAYLFLGTFFLVVFAGPFIMMILMDPVLQKEMEEDRLRKLAKQNARARKQRRDLE